MKVLEIPEVNLEDEELKLALATKLLEEGKISLGKAAEIAGCVFRSNPARVSDQVGHPVGVTRPL